MNVAQRTVLIFVPLALVVTSVAFLLHRSNTASVQAVGKAREANVVEVGHQHATMLLDRMSADLLYLSDLQALQKWFKFHDAADHHHLATAILAFITRMNIYDQALLLDLEGQEAMRVELQSDEATLVSNGEPPTEAEIRTMNEALSLKRGEVYVSPLELNIAHGAIEQPAKPVLRLATPVYDVTGRKQGVFILNYKGQLLLDSLQSLDDLGASNVWLLNKDGYWLIGPTSEDEWAFMYPERKERSFAHDYPEIWNKLRRGPRSGQFMEGDALYTYVKISPFNRLRTLNTASSPSRGERWYFLTRVSTETLTGDAIAFDRRLTDVLLVLYLLIAMASWLMARHWLTKQKIEESVRLSEERFRALLEAAPDSVIVTNKSGEIVFVNKQTEYLFKYPSNQLVGQRVEMLMPEQFRKGHVEHRQDYAAAPRVLAMGMGRYLHGLRSDGTEFPIEVSLSPVETAQGVMIFCDIRDMTNQRQAEKKIHDLNQRLERDNAELAAVNKELEAFSYSVSHDLRAPLRAIDGFSQALLEDHGDHLDDTGRRYLERVRQAAQRMGMLIDDLIKLARVTRSDTHFEEVDVTALVNTIGGVLQERDPGRQIRLAVPEGVKIQADARLMRIALENLLENAWKFSAGRDVAEIAFGSFRGDKEQIYFVRDNGVGFDMTYAGKLFGAFQRLHDNGLFPGTGIGLATVQRIIHKHGGRIWAESAVDKGATFYFTL